jgi:hypothetical protein
MLNDLDPNEYNELYAFFLKRQWGSSINDLYQCRNLQAVLRSDKDYRLMAKREDKPDLFTAIERTFHI